VVVHGQGIGEEVQKERLGRYLQAVDGALRPSLRNHEAPLVLAGVEYVRAMYRTINTYPHVLEAGISGSPDRTSSEELHSAAWALVEPLFARGRDEAAAAYREALGTGRASDSLEEVLTAAEAGRVDVLFVPTGTRVLSATNGSAGFARADGKQELGGPDLIEQAVVRTMLNGGTVYAVPEGKMPNRAAVAALFRF
jgi:hypothetical protein